MNPACPICRTVNGSSSTVCAKCGSPLTASASPRNYLNDGAYDSPLARRVEKETMERRVNTASVTLLVLGLVQGCWLPIYLTIHSGPEQEASRILVGTLLSVFCLAYIRIAIWSRKKAFPALIAGMALYSTTAVAVILRAGHRALQNSPDAIQALGGLLISCFIIGILLSGLLASLRLRSWTVAPP